MISRREKLAKILPHLAQREINIFFKFKEISKLKMYVLEITRRNKENLISKTHFLCIFPTLW